MKKLFTILFVSVLLLGLTFAAQEGVQDGTGPEHEEFIAAGGQGGEPVAGEGIGVKVKAGEYKTENGKSFMFQEMAENRLRIKSGDSFADCDDSCELRQEKVGTQTKFLAKLSNGKDSEVKIMPDSASETALARLRLKVCSEELNCSIELKEVGQGEQVRLAYELQTERESKIFGLFKAKMQVRAQVDAENGEVLRVKKPWWAFLASEPEETA